MSTRLRLLLSALAAVAAAVALTTGGLGASAATVEDGRYPDREGRMVAPTPSVGERAASIALGAVGIPYRWGGESPSSGFDCSGLVRWTYGRLGIELPHNSYALYGEGQRVSRARMRPGDVLFFEGLGHVGLYLGRGRMVHAPQTGRDVEVVRLARSSYGSRLVGARRVTAA